MNTIGNRTSLEYFMWNCMPVIKNTISPRKAHESTCASNK